MVQLNDPVPLEPTGADELIVDQRTPDLNSSIFTVEPTDPT